MIILDKDGNVQDNESKTDIFGLGIYSKGSKEGASSQTDNTYYQDRANKQAKQQFLAIENIFSVPMHVGLNLALAPLSGLSKFFASAAQATEEDEDEDKDKDKKSTPPIGQATPLQIPIPSPQSLFQLSVGKSGDNAEEDEDEEEEKEENGAEVFFKPLLAPLQALFNVTAKDEEEEEEKEEDVQVF